jgi:hypothetical protein
MPYLDKDQLEGPHANLYLFTVMLTPSAPVVQRRLFNCFSSELDHRAIQQFKPLIEARHSAGFRDFFSEDAHKRLDQMLFHAAPIAVTADSIQADYERGLDDGMFTGQVLLRCLERSESQEQAFKYFRTTVARGLGRAAESRKWRRARRAAHLWAQALGTPIPSPYSDNSMRRFRLWLAAAERLRRQAEHFVPKGRDGPLLNPEETWWIPKGLKRQS